MIKKLSMVLLGLSIFLLLFLTRSSVSGGFDSTASLDGYDGKLRLHFSLTKEDKYNLNSIARSLGQLALTDVSWDASTELVDAITALDLGEFKLSTTPTKVVFTSSGAFGAVDTFDPRFLDSETFLLVETKLLEKMTVPYRSIFDHIKDKTLSLTAFENNPTLLITGKIEERAKYEAALKDLQAKKSGLEDQKEATSYSEFDLAGGKGISFGAPNQPSLFLLEKEGIMLASDNLGYLKKLVATKITSTIEADPDFKEARKEFADTVSSPRDYIYVNFDRLLKNNPEKTLETIRYFTQLSFADEMKSDLNYSKLKSLYLSWNEQTLNGSLKIK